MKKNKLTIYFLIFLSALFFKSFSQTPFTGGNLVVMYVGDGSTPTLLSSGYQEYVLEITTTGSVVQTITLPSTTSGSRCVESGSASSDADLNTSGDGKLITFGGYDTTVGALSVASASNINRIICQLNSSGVVSFPASFSGNNASGTALYVGNNFRSVLTNDGTGFWTAGTGTRGGIDYIPSGTLNATTASAGVAQLNTGFTNARVIKIFKNQLYGNANSGSFKDVFTVGTGLPVSGTPTYTVLNGLPNTHDGYSFVLFDRDGNGAVDLLYIADFTNGLLKYYLNGSTWTAAGSLTGGISGITGYLDCNNNPVLFSTKGTSGPSNNKIYSYTDATSNATSISGTLASTATSILTAGNGYIFRGIAMAPTKGDISLSSGSITLSGSYRSITITGGTATLSGTNVYASDSIYIGSGATLICGTTFLKGRKFVLASGATIKIGSASGITASSALGNIQTSCRSFSTGANYVYNGSVAQATGDGLPSNVYSLTLNNSSASGVVTLTNPLTVSYLATFTLGFLTTTATNLLTIASTGFVSGSSITSFVNGPVRKVGNTSFIFPTGKSGEYAPVSISAPSVLTDHFTAEYFNSNPDPTYNSTLKDPSIDHVSMCEYWMLDRTGGTSDVSVELSWDTPRSCGVTTLSDMIVAHWDTNLTTPIWKDMGNSFTSGGPTAGTIITAGAVTSFSPFTLASISSVNPLPIELVNFSANLNNDQVDLNWTTATEVNNNYFTIERAKDGVNFEELNVINGAGNSTSYINYTSVDSFPFNGQSYYRLKQTDYDGNQKYSQTVTINKLDELIVENVFPNPSSELLTIQFNNNCTNQVQVTIVDFLGQEVYKTINSNRLLTIDLSAFTAGIYILKVNGFEMNYQQKIIKQ